VSDIVAAAPYITEPRAPVTLPLSRGLQQVRSMKKTKLNAGAAAAGLVMIVLLGVVPPSGAGEISKATRAPRPALGLPDLHGQTRNLEEFRGKVLLVNFWASWCSPCLREMPSIQRLADQMRGRPFAVIAVNVEESRFRAMRTVQQMKLGFPVLLDAEGTAFRAWGGNVLPTTYLLDKEGVIRYVGRGPVEWDSSEPVAIIEALMGLEPAAGDSQAGADIKPPDSPFPKGG
jgi:thiol-disulfide isomerase/thioredoxin